MILHLYFARRFLNVFMITLLIFFAFLTLIDLVEQMRRFSERDVGFTDILQLTLLNAPNGLYQILPLVMILASVSLFISLAKSSELVVARAAGRSALLTLVSPVVVAGLIGTIAVGLFNPFVAATSKRFSELEDTYKAGGVATISFGREGLWLRQGDDLGQSVINAKHSNATATYLSDVSFLEYDLNNVPVRRVVAASAELTSHGWLLRNAKSWPLQNSTNPEQNAVTDLVLVLPTTLTEERIKDSFAAPSMISIWNLRTYADQLDAAGFSSRRHRVWMQMEMARPLFLVAMVLVGAGFTMRHSRFGKTGVSVLAAIMLGFSLYYVRNFAQILGENGQLPTVLAAWTPPVASILLALGLLLHMEDG